ncbi:hypothetical protein [Nocardioides sp.]|uniref:hypothetical protein n=1 Tax=Nocardioides sp. TaxID=35761 RepID=UPI002CAF9B76|nr:hypothetical protein [Nocardioides sp.]HXH80914.1 hypothetical protein [Nocardioides sp.]
MEMKEYRAALVAGWKVIVATVLVALLIGGAVAFATARSSEPQFASSRKVLLTVPGTDSPDGETYEESGLTARTLSYAELVNGTAMAERVIEELGEGSDVGTVSAVAISSTTVLNVNVTHGDEEQAKKVADTYVQLLPEVIAEVDEPQDDSGAVRVTLISSEDGFVVAPSSGAPRIMLLALMMGLGLGVGWALLRYTASTEAAEARP